MGNFIRHGVTFRETRTGVDMMILYYKAESRIIYESVILWRRARVYLKSYRRVSDNLKSESSIHCRPRSVLDRVTCIDNESCCFVTVVDHSMRCH
jgi:hypothetical protein